VRRPTASGRICAIAASITIDSATELASIGDLIAWTSLVSPIPEARENLLLVQRPPEHDNLTQRAEESVPFKPTAQIAPTRKITTTRPYRRCLEYPVREHFGSDAIMYDPHIIPFTEFQHIGTRDVVATTTTAR